MPRTSKVTSSRSTPRPSTRSQQQQSPPRSKLFMTILKQQQNNSMGGRGEVSDNDNDSVSSSSKSSDVVITRPSVAKTRSKDETGTGKVAAPWRHPDELDYFRPYNWSEDKIITHLRAMVFSVPSPVNGKQSFIEIMLFDDGDFEKLRPIKVPRGYRVPLMFVAKFQWASLKLVLTSAQREKEWSDYKFDILHLSRLCARFFSEAREACDVGVFEIPPMKNAQVPDGAMSRKWRCPTFDRALSRYNKNWLISREEFLRDFYIEFEDEEYAKDVLKIDWSRWALRGHKGFKLTQDELKSGIDARMITRGLKKDNNGRWVWVDDILIKQEEVAAAVNPLASGNSILASSSPAAKEGKTTSPLSHTGDESIPHENGRATAEPNLSTVAAPATETESPSRSSPPKPSTRASSDAISEHTARQPSPFVEKFHSPLSSIPSSASPSEVPVQTFDQQQAGGHKSVPAPPPKTSSANLEPPSADRTASLPFQSLPPLVIPSSPTAPTGVTPASEGTQPPKSQSPPLPSGVEGRTQDIDDVAGFSPLTPINPETSPGEQGQHSAINQEVVPEGVISDRKHSPTSIDSTPKPSPGIQPQDVTGPTQPGGTPTLLDTPDNGPFAASSQVTQSYGPHTDPPFFMDPAFWLEPQHTEYIDPARYLNQSNLLMDRTKPNIIAEPPPGTPYGRPRSPILDVQKSAPEPVTSEISQTPVRHQSPIFLSPLLPPAEDARSSSPDEIPGLGGLSSRRPLSLPLRFVAPKMTARTVTDGSNWFDARTEPKKEVHEPDILMFIEQGDLDAEFLEAYMQSSEDDPGSWPRPAKDDDNSDMDFGTPEISPIIIVPDPQADGIESLPPPIAPYTLPSFPPKEDLPKTETLSPNGGLYTSKPASAELQSAARTPAGLASIPQMLRDGVTGEIERLPRLKTSWSLQISPENCSTSAYDGPGSSMEVTHSNDTLACRDSGVANGISSQPATPSPTKRAPEPASQGAPGSPNPILPGSGFSSVQDAQITSTPSIDGHGTVPPFIASRRQPDGFVTPVSRAQSFGAPSDNQIRPQAQGLQQNSPVPSTSSWRQYQPQSMPLDVDMTQLPLQSSPRRHPPPTHTNISQMGSYTNHQSYDSPLGQSSASQAPSTSRKRQRENETEEEADEETVPKSRKRNEGHSNRESDVVVRKVVSMVRDTLTGLNDLLEITSEQDLISTDRSWAKSKGKGRAMDESPLYSPATPSPLSRTHLLSRAHAESLENARLNRELQSLKAEILVLRERSSSDALDTGEPGHIRAMRTELDMLREQIRVLKEAKPPPAGTIEVKTMREELSTLRNDIRSLQDTSRRSSAPSTPSTPNLTFRFNSHTMTQTVHPLAHLLAVEPDTATPIVLDTDRQPTLPQPDGDDPSRQRPSVYLEASETRTGAASIAPRPPVFDDIPLPVKSKRKARMMFSRS